MEIRAAEISAILKQQIKNFGDEADVGVGLHLERVEREGQPGGELGEPGRRRGRGGSGVG